MPKAKHPFAEYLLALFAGHERAGVIYGDLTEMAATRGRTWFLFAYVRTLLFFTWRTPVALFAAVVSVKYLRSRVFSRLLGAYYIHPNYARIYQDRMLVHRHPYLSQTSWTVSLAAVNVLWIVLPYIAIRFGLRNRLTYLAGVLFLLALPAYTFRPEVFFVTGVASALVVAASVASSGWRRQMLFLIATYPVGPLVFYVCIAHPVLAIFRHGPFPQSVFGMRIDEPVAIAILAILCPFLYRWLLQPRSDGAAHA
jgi:hypothetical protein